MEMYFKKITNKQKIKVFITIHFFYNGMHFIAQESKYISHFIHFSLDSSSFWGEKYRSHLVIVYIKL